MAKRRPNGDGTIRKRADGRWEGRVQIGHKADGSAVYEYVFAKTQKAMLEKAHRLQEEYKGVDLNADGDMTLGQWLDQWMESYGKLNLRPSTVREYTSDFLRVKQYIGDKPIRKVTTAEVQRMYNSISKTGRMKPDNNGSRALSASYVRHIHMVLHEALEAACGARLIAKNPTKGTVIPRMERKEMRVLNDEQLDRFLSAAGADPFWCDFFYLELTTGLRRGEICGLRWEDFDAASGMLYVRRSVSADGWRGRNYGETKTEAGRRDILLPESAKERLELRKKSSFSEWIFPHFLQPDRPIEPNSCYRRMKEILKENDLPDIRFHDLRHTFATHALRTGIDAKTLSKLLGHTNASFTLDTYTHITREMQIHAAGVVEDLMTDIFGKDLTPWETEEKRETAP